MPGVDIIVRNNAGDLVTLKRYLSRDGWEVTQNAEEGSVGISTLYLDDVDQSVWDTLGLNVGARRQIRLVDLTSNRIVHFGYTARRTIKRRYDDKGHPLGRAWGVEIWDSNTIIARRVMKGKDAKRPRETDVERIQWLLSTAEWDIVDQFLIGTNSKTMSKADLRGQMVGQIVADCAQQANKNYWLDIADTGAGDRITFWYGKDNRDVYESPLSISNDLADIDIDATNAGTATVYFPGKETEYQMIPDRVYTGIFGTYEKGSVYRHSNTAATQFTRWDTVMQWPNIHEKDRAIERALNMLERLSEQGEEQRIEGSGVLVPASKAHLIRAGMRIPVKLMHIPAMADYTDCRILSRGLSPRADGAMYWIPLILEPIGPADLGPSCSLALSNAHTAGVSQQHATVPGTGSTEPVSFSITPAAGEDCIIVAVAASCNSNVPTDTDMTGTGDFATLHSDNSDFGHPTAAHIWAAVANPTGPVDVTAEFTAGFTPTHPAGKSSWAGIAVSFATSATSPVQSKGNVDIGSTTVTLDAPPTPGNILIMSIASRNSNTSDTQTLSPSDGWTQLGAENCYPTTQDKVGLYARCVQDGDGSVYGGGLLGSGRSNVVAVSEWEIT